MSVASFFSPSSGDFLISFVVIRYVFTLLNIHTQIRTATFVTSHKTLFTIIIDAKLKGKFCFHIYSYESLFFCLCNINSYLNRLYFLPFTIWCLAAVFLSYNFTTTFYVCILFLQHFKFAYHFMIKLLVFKWLHHRFDSVLLFVCWVSAFACLLKNVLNILRFTFIL